MKKILLILCLFLLCACSNSDEISRSENETYLDIINQLQEHEDFSNESELFDVTFDIAKTNDAYRFYIIIDNAKTAMYDICAVAIEKNVDYSKTMAANIGIFEDKKYSLIPNQSNPSKGYMKGISISGITNKNDPELYLLVEWNNKDMSKTHYEYIKVNNEVNNVQQ